jgi:hypothetical protein
MKKIVLGGLCMLSLACFGEIHSGASAAEVAAQVAEGATPQVGTMLQQMGNNVAFAGGMLFVGGLFTAGYYLLLPVVWDSLTPGQRDWIKRKSRLAAAAGLTWFTLRQCPWVPWVIKAIINTIEFAPDASMKLVPVQVR